MTIIIAGTISVEPDRVNDLMAVLTPLMQATHQEDGCHAYVFSLDPIEEGLVHVYEKWESDEHLAAHFQTPHVTGFQAESAGLGITGMDILKHEVASEGPLR